MNNGFSVLLVEDDPNLREFLMDQINQLGYHALSVDCVESAIEFLSERSVDIILTDLKMPDGFSGMVLCEWVANQCNGHTKVLVMTGHLDEFDERRAASYGVVDFLPKPFSLTHLRASLEEVLMSTALPVAA